MQEPTEQPLPNPTGEPRDKSLIPTPHEREIIKPEVIFIDEKNPLNPYTRHGELTRFLDFSGDNAVSLSPVSNEGFYHNEDRQREVGNAFSQIFALGSRGDVLEVGPGGNTYIAEGILSNTGISISLLDSKGGVTDGVIHEASAQGGFRNYSGTIADISSQRSELRDRRFGTIMFNGSWVAGGYNFTVKDNLSIEYQRRNQVRVLNSDSPEYITWFNEQLDKILQSSKEHLTDNGVLVLSSARYAYHGAGYSFVALPVEKLEVLDVIARAQNLGAKKITVIGVSSDAIQEMLQHNLSDEEMHRVREEQIFRKLFLGRTFTKGPDYTLTKKDGTELTVDELQAFYKNPDRRAAFLKQFPDFAEVVGERLKEYELMGQEVVEQLTRGVDGLPNSVDHGYQTPDEIRTVKHQTKDIIPQNIARIDAIGIEF